MSGNGPASAAIAETVVERAATAETMAPGPTSRDAAAPDRIGRLVVLDPLGEGAMGRVYSAYDPDLDRRVAVKLLHGCSEDAEQAVRIRREAHAMARLSHPNVVQVFEVGQYAEQTYIAMEFVDGGTLDDWLRAERRPWQEIVEMFLRVGVGLAAAHAAGLVHRDFKPHNVLVGADGRPRIIDFGLARADAERQAEAAVTPAVGEGAPALPTGGDVLRSPLTRAGSFLGTPAYMAPEQMNGAGVSVASDQFAFCTSLFEALYDKPPFDNSTLLNRLLAMEDGEVAAAPSDSLVPGRVYRTLVRGMAADPAERWPSMVELLDTLDHDEATDRSIGWKGRLGFFGVLLLLALALKGVDQWVAGGLQTTALSMLVTDVLAVTCMCAIGWRFRAAFTGNAHNRRLMAWLGVMVFGPLLVRGIGLLTGTPAPALVAFVLASEALLAALAALLIVRWAGPIAAILAVGAVVAAVWPAYTVATYSGTMIVAIGVAIVVTVSEARAAGETPELAELHAQLGSMARSTASKARTTATRLRSSADRACVSSGASEGHEEASRA